MRLPTYDILPCKDLNVRFYLHKQEH